MRSIALLTLALLACASGCDADHRSGLARPAVASTQAAATAEAAALEVRVLDAAGEPLEGAFVIPSAGDDGLVPEGLAAEALLTDAEGRCSLRLPRGRYAVQVVGEGGQVGQAEVDLTTGGAALSLTARADERAVIDLVERGEGLPEPSEEAGR